MGPLSALRTWWRNRAATTRENPLATPNSRRGFSALSVNVTEDNALTLSSVWCAVRAISESISAMPYHVFQKQGKNRIARSDHPVDWLLSMQPNPEQVALDFWDWALQRCLLWGNAYAEIERNARGEPANLWPIEPWRVFIRRNAAGGLEYVVTNQTREYTVLNPDDVYHLHGLGDGLQGYSVIGMARDSIGAGLTMEQFGSEFFANGARTGAVIKAPVGVSMPKDAVDAMKSEFDRMYSGRGNRFKTGFLDKGMEIDYPSIPPEDAQFIQTRQLNVIDMCRWFRVPPHLVYDLSRATFSNIEFQALDFVTHTLGPWARKIETQTNIKLFGRVQRGVFYSKLNFDSMLRGDMKSRFEAYGLARQWGIYSTNDILELEDRNPVKGGDDRIIPLNMTVADLLREQAQANIKKTNQPPAAPADPKPAPNARVVELVRRFEEGR